MLIITLLLIIGIVFAFIGYSTENALMTRVGTGVVIVIVTLFVCSLIGYGLLVAIPSWSCKHAAEVMGMECKYDAFAGCLVKYNGSWYPIDSRRVVE